MNQEYDIVLILDFGFVSNSCCILYGAEVCEFSSPSLMSSQKKKTLPKEQLVTTHIHLYVFISSVRKKYFDKNNCLGDELWEYTVLVPSANCSADQRGRVGTVCVQDVSCLQ